MGVLGDIVWGWCDHESRLPSWKRVFGVVYDVGVIGRRHKSETSWGAGFCVGVREDLSATDAGQWVGFLVRKSGETATTGSAQW